ncbi:MAG: PTS fructose transporter subunit IIC [Galactobacillus timonensis]|uniref:PTS fructose transporter subunit IIC n=2 Tax=Galactobacillus timonensis TaxID=2041840 RepID=UPI0023EF9F86|nr:PTS fructose transporter subunit IIC [Galactobacillus timonensis]MCI6068536.1 PTS fructose transporter subunit IIC [Galactobacillus timonensis]MCI6754871.1 PTS fructose transporter subunit IIC [Galactobacillus timonensis]MDD7087434.1 PTS fructose transporter subunit IIC [Galactobacillus timonensis]MDY5223431.1 PTS fructose transporter subunit IIC [Lachnospiraceae bacterium]
MKWQEFKKHLMTGISFMIPMVVAGGILGALAKGLGGYTIGSMGPEAGATAFSNLNAFNWTQYWWAISKLSDFAMSFVCGVLAAGIAYSMADRPGIVPAFIIGYTANQAKAGFLGAMLMAYIVGVIVLWMEKWKLPKALQGLMPVLIIPVLATLISGSLFFWIICKPMALVMTAFQNWIQSLSSGSLFIIGAVIGACMGFDMGGPINKTASMAANALFADDPDGTGIGSSAESAKIVGGMTPPLGIGIATIIAKNKFTQEQRDAGITCIPMGLCFITEGVLPFAAEDPLRVIPSSMIGSAIAGGMVMAMGCHTPAAHGGIFIVPVTTNPGAFLLALAVGTIVTAILYAVLKKPLDESENVEEKVDDNLDINIQ